MFALIVFDFGFTNADTRPGASWAALLSLADREGGVHADERPNIGSSPTSIEDCPDDMALLWNVVAWPRQDAQRELEAIETRCGSPGSAPLSPLCRAYNSITFRYLLENFTANYLMIAHLHPQNEGIGRRVLLKYSYDIGFDYPLATTKRFLWAPVEFELQLGTTLPARSLHFEVYPPEGLELTFAHFSAESERAPRTWAWQEAVDRDLHSYRTISHHHLRGTPIAARFVGAAMFSVQRGAVVLVTVGASLLLTAAVWLGTRWPEVVVEGEATTRSVLLLLPGVLSGSIVLQREHRYVRHLMLGVRIVVVALVVLSMLAVVSMLIAVEHDPTSGRVLMQASTANLTDYWGLLRWPVLLTLLMMLPSLVPVSLQRWWVLRRHDRERPAPGTEGSTPPPR